MKLHRHLRSRLAFCLLTLTTGISQAVITPIIKPGDAGWDYLDNNISIATYPTWKNVGFTPSSPWVLNAMEDFGYPKNDTDPVHTLKTEILFGGNVNNRAITYYFRKTFTIADTNAVKQLIIGLRRDDGAVVYINGEAIRDSAWDNMPATGTITSSTLALSAVSGTNETRYYEKIIANDKPSNVTQRLLVTGTNVVAVEVHQNAANSNDVHFGLSLNVSDQELCFGEVTPGISCRFNQSLEVVNSAEKKHVRYFPATDTDMQFNVTYFRINGSYPEFGVGTPSTSLLTNEDMESRALAIDPNTSWTFTSEPIDTRNFTNIKAKVKIRGYNSSSNANPNPNLSPGPWETGDFVKGSILTSVDGKTFGTSIPWFETRGGTGSTAEVRTTFLAPTANCHYLVPTATNDPSTLSPTNPNWTLILPTGWTTISTPPASPSPLWAASSGGQGYDDNTTVDYGPQINATSKVPIRAAMYNITRAMYIRYPFTVSNRSDYNKWYLKMRYDDGYVAFVNGIKVAEKLASASPYNRNSFASGNRADSTCLVPEEVDITSFINPSAGVFNVTNDGNNVLCILALNETTTSSDLMAQPELLAGKPGPVTGLALLNSLGDAGPFPAPLPAFLDTGSLIPNGISSMKIKIEGAIDNGRTTMGDGNEAMYIDDIETSGDAINPYSFDTYATAQIANTSLRGMTQDADLDGIQNMMEYALGSPMGTNNQTVSPVTGTMSVLPTVSYDVEGRMIMKFRKINYDPDAINPFSDPLSAYSISADGFIQVNDVKYIPQMTYSLGNPADPLSAYDQNFDLIWLDGTQSTFFSEVLPRVKHDDGTETVTIRTINSVIGDKTRVYMRLKIQLVRPSFIQEDVPACPF